MIVLFPALICNKQISKNLSNERIMEIISACRCIMVPYPDFPGITYGLMPAFGTYHFCQKTPFFIVEYLCCDIIPKSSTDNTLIIMYSAVSRRVVIVLLPEIANPNFFLVSAFCAANKIITAVVPSPQIFQYFIIVEKLFHSILSL